MVWGVTNDLIKSFERSGKSQISVLEVCESDVSKYGIVKTTNVQHEVSGIIEKPQTKGAPSNLACIGGYVVTSDIFKILKNQAPGRGDEIQLADAFNTQAIEGNVQCR